MACVTSVEVVSAVFARAWSGVISNRLGRTIALAGLLAVRPPVIMLPALAVPQRKTVMSMNICSRALLTIDLFTLNFDAHWASGAAFPTSKPLH